jgi:hypothetical protein
MSSCAINTSHLPWSLDSAFNQTGKNALFFNYLIVFYSPYEPVNKPNVKP